MKIKLISRNDDNYTRETKFETTKEVYNPHPSLHKFEKPREYVRALNFTKYEKWFARPFVSAVDGHGDTPQCIGLHPRMINILVSGDCSGELIMWNMTSRNRMWNLRNCHKRFVNGVNFSDDGKRVFTCGGDGILKLFKFSNSGLTLKEQYKNKFPLSCLDAQRGENVLGTGGEKVLIWDSTKLVPKSKFKLGFDDVVALKFSRVEKSVVGCCTGDNRVCILDLKSGQIVNKFEMMRRTSCLCFNPMRAFQFTVGSDDTNCYTFDLRKLSSGPMLMHSAHVGPVTCVDYSPGGLEFSSGSFDKTVRIFRVDNTKFHSREIYHTQRMQRVFSVRYSLDAKFIYSGSDDHAIRVWKTRSDEPLRVVSRAERRVLQYQKSLVDRYKDFSEVRRIKDFRHVPRKIRSETLRRKAQIGKLRRKEKKKLKKIDYLQKGNTWKRDVKRTFRGEQE